MCGAGGIWEISLSSAQFCGEPKTALKKSSKTRMGGKVHTDTQMEVKYILFRIMVVNYKFYQSIVANV